MAFVTSSCRSLALEWKEAGQHYPMIVFVPLGGTGPVRERTVVADPPVYCPVGKSEPPADSAGRPELLRPGRLGSSDRGRGRVCSNRMRFRMSSELGAGVPSSASRRRCRFRSARVCLWISSMLGGKAISSNCPPGVSIRMIRPRCSSRDNRRAGTRRLRAGRGQRFLRLITDGPRQRGSWANSSPDRRRTRMYSNNCSLSL